MVMINSDQEDPDDLDRIARSPDAVRDGWGRTIEDTRRMMTDREEDGYETLMLPAGDTTPKNPDSGETNEWGLSYTIPGNKAEPFLEFTERASFDETAVYQKAEGGNVFIVTECIDLNNKLSLFVIGAYQMRFASPMVRTAMDRGEMHTHIKKLDGTHLQTIEHRHPEAFFPNPNEFYAFETDEIYNLE